MTSIPAGSTKQAVGLLIATLLFTTASVSADGPGGGGGPGGNGGPGNPNPGGPGNPNPGGPGNPNPGNGGPGNPNPGNGGPGNGGPGNGGPGNGGPGNGGPVQGGGTVDPILQDFAGVTFEFYGKPGGVYAIYSDESHQVNMALMPSNVSGHIGTYMTDFGFAFQDTRVHVSLANQEGEILVQSWKNTYTAHSLLLGGEEEQSQMTGPVNITIQPYRPYTGRTVFINTGAIEFSAWSTPAGLVDSFNVSQPAYMNFNITLFSAPTGNRVEGIIGESLYRTSVSDKKQQAASADNVSAGLVPNPSKGNDDAYAVSSIFGTDFAFNQFYAGAKLLTSRRLLKTSPFASLEFPLKGSSRYEK